MLSAAFGFITGLILGSFIEAAAGRIGCKETLWGRSHCPGCKHKLGYCDLFPVFSYLLLKGKCRYCHKKIPLEDLLVELIMGAVVAVLFLTTVPNIAPLLEITWPNIFLGLDLIFKMFVLVILAIIFLTDLKTGLIPNVVVYPAVAVTVVYYLVINILKSWIFYQSLVNSVIGKYLLLPHSSYLYDHILRIWQPAGWAFLCGVSIAAIFALLIIITRGRGMGWGDVKYVFFLGLAIGLPGSVLGIFLSFFLGAVISILLILFGKKHFGQTIPFGPFLSVGAAIALIWGSQIINWYFTSLKLGY